MVARRLIVGCGYLGRRVAQRWRLTGDEVFVLTRSADHAHEFAALGLQPVVGDVLSVDSLRSLPQADLVLYAVGFDRSSEATKRSVYVDGLRNVLSIVATSCRRLIYVSSTSVYGQDAGEFVDEGSVAAPTEESGRICREAEQLVWEFFPKNVQPDARGAVILRLAGIYGPGRLLTRVEQLRRGEPLSGNPDAWLNLIHVEDAVRAVVAAESHAKPGETFVVSDGHPARRGDYYRALAEQVGAPPPQFQTADASALAYWNKRCVNRRLREQLGVTLEFPTFIEGLASLPELSPTEPHQRG